MRDSFFPSWIICTLCLSMLSGISGLHAQEKIQESLAADKKQALEKIEKILSENNEKTSQLKEEIELLRKEKGRLQKALIESANKQKFNEEELKRSQEVTQQNQIKLHSLEKENQAKSHVFAETISAAISVGSNPLPAVLIAPKDALQTIKTSILLESILPDLKTTLEEHKNHIAQLNQVQNEYLLNQKELSQNLQNFNLEKQRLDALYALRESTLNNRQEELSLLARQAQEYAQDAKSLKELLSKIDKNFILNNAAKANFKNFADFKGFLQMPVRGPLLSRFGQLDTHGQAEQGITIDGTTQGIVSAPFEGYVLFVGPFRSFGHVVIINVGQGYNILLAGLSKTIVDIGQHVLSGEPLGRLSLEKSQAKLYLEIRKSGEVIDPSPWFSKQVEARSKE